MARMFNSSRETGPQAEAPDVEVLAKAKRRRFTGTYKLRVSREADALAETGGLEVLVSMGAESRQRRCDFRPPRAPRASAPICSAWAQAIKDKLESERGRALYRLRQQTMEPVFGIIKNVLGFTRFWLRGHAKVEGEWQLVCLAYNCKWLHRLMALAPA